MVKPRKTKRSLVVKASVWLKGEERFTVQRNLDHTPLPGEILKIGDEPWRVVN